MARSEARTCFVIMPFGERADGAGGTIHFDRVYEELIDKAVSGLDLDVVRSDDIMRAGTIHLDMLRHIATAAVAIVDLTLLNPNVFYELGVRHALRPSVTVLIKRKDAPIPFNIHSERVIEYPAPGSGYEEAIATIRAFIEAGLNSVKPDSPIFNLLQDARKDWKAERITRHEEFRYRLRTRPEKTIAVITGDLCERDGIDVWVNSENTQMQMARLYDRSLSATIRFAGARKDDDGEVVEDTIADELTALMKKGNRLSVNPGTVYVTGAGALTENRGVKRIFHAASVIGVPGKGYLAMPEVETCVTNALRKMDDKRFAEEQLRSIVFPMMGTGTGGASVDVVAPRLIEAAVAYLLNTPGSRVETVYFSAWNYRDVDACRSALNAIDGVEPCPA
jgi:O-acetyl-ADP-ribose deacetylase (regulator of RNase III)